MALGARRVERCQQLAEQILASGGEVTVHALDLADDGSVQAFAKGVTSALGEIEVVVSNAGRVSPGVVREIDTPHFVGVSTST